MLLVIKPDDLDLVFTINSTRFSDHRNVEMSKSCSVSDTLLLRRFVQAIAEDWVLTSTNS